MKWKESLIELWWCLEIQPNKSEIEALSTRYLKQDTHQLDNEEVKLRNLESKNSVGIRSIDQDSALLKIDEYRKSFKSSRNHTSRSKFVKKNSKNQYEGGSVSSDDSESEESDEDESRSLSSSRNNSNSFQRLAPGRKEPSDSNSKDKSSSFSGMGNSLMMNENQEKSISSDIDDNSISSSSANSSSITISQDLNYASLECIKRIIRIK